MSVSDINVSTVVLRKAIGEGVHTGVEHPTCESFFVPFGKRGEDLEDEGNVELGSAFRLLGTIASLRLNPDNADRPFEAFLAQETSRTPILDDLTDSQLQIVSEVAAEIVDAELRARLADVVWIRRRDYQLAQLAVSAYTASGSTLLPTLLASDGIKRFERALQIAAMLGRQQPLFEQTLTVIEDACADDDQKDYVVALCLDLLLKFRARDAEKFAELAKARANSDKTKSSELWQRRFWELAAKWYDRADRSDDARTARIEVAKSFEREADDALSRENAPSVLVAMSFLENAMQAYRRVADTEADRERVHRRLLDVGQKAISEFPTFTLEAIDLSDCANAAKASIKGKSIEEALRHVALSGRTPRKAQLRTDAEESTRNHPLAFLFPATTLGSSGKVVAKQGAMSSTSPDDKESTVLREMFRNASLERAVLVRGQIEPMRQQLLTEYHVRYDDFLPFVSYNPLVPPGREHLYVIGLHAGLHGDLVLALHVLIPQFENSVRYVLSNHGVITSGIDADGIQMERDLNALLYEPKFEEVFGEDLAFDLRGLLVERAGENFRNQMAHGMLEHGTFFGDTALYIWWLMLRSCCLATLPPSAMDVSHATGRS